MKRARAEITPDTGRENGLQSAHPQQGRTSGPIRRSTSTCQWTSEEDAVICSAVQQFNGRNWKKIAECLKDRTTVQCLHRWQKVLDPKLVKGPWLEEEDVILIEMVKQYGEKKWSTIAQALPGRIGKQCRERWHNHLNPSINKEAWIEEEEMTLIKMHQAYGNKWAELTKFLPGRTENTIKNHWNSSLKKKLDSATKEGQNSIDNSSNLNRGEHAKEILDCDQGSTGIGYTQAECTMENTASVHVQKKFRTEEGNQGNGQSSSNPSSYPTRNSTYLEEFTRVVLESPCEVAISENPTENCLLHEGESCGREDASQGTLFELPCSFMELLQESSADDDPSFSGKHNGLGDMSSGIRKSDFIVSSCDDFIYHSSFMTSCDSDAEEVCLPIELEGAQNALKLRYVESNQANDATEALLYEPSHSSKAESSFFTCELIPSGVDILKEEYSPLGIRQLLRCSMDCWVPFNLETYCKSID